MPFFAFWTKGSLYVALFISVQVYCAAHAETRVCLHSTSRFPLQLSCPRRHVIMSPNVMVGKMAGSLQPNGDCQYNSQRDCFGTTPEVVAQANECHFQKACSITLNRYMPITSSANRSCLALRPDYAILYSHECVRRKSLHFLCGGRSGEEPIKRKEGVLVSHDAYPWHYQGYRDCIANLTAPKRHHRLSLWSEDLDIDPENRDSITLYNVTSDCSTELIGEPIKSSAMGLNITVPSSEVVIKFSIGEFTKSGRGFVIKFKWLRGGAKGRVKTASCRQSKGKKNKKGKKKNKKKKHNRNGSSIATTTPSGAQKTKRPRGRNSRRNGRKGKKTRNMTP